MINDQSAISNQQSAIQGVSMAHILVIDDDQATLQLLIIMLEHEGYQVSVASDGFQGLKLARKQRPDLVLLDLMLPGIDGFEVCSRLRQEPATATVPVLIVSAKSQQTDRAAGAKVGANGYLTKPYQRKGLIAQVRLFLDQSQAAAAAPTAPPGFVLTIVAVRESEVIARAVVNMALALAGTDMRVTLVDLRPFSIEYCMLLDLMPRAASLDLAQHDPAAIERDGVVVHPGGLRLLNNLTGSGEVGQIASADVTALLNGQLSQGGCVVLGLPLYPVELLRDVAARSNLIEVATPIDSAGLAATRSALGLIDRLGVGSSHIGLVLVGDATAPVPDLGREVLATLTPWADAKDPSFAALAARLQERRERLSA
jgi:DNA-binding response OmpR family regulator